MDETPRRWEKRIPVDVLGVPLLISGVRTRHVVHCQLINLSQRGIGVRIQADSLRAASIEIGTLMNVHLPFRMEGGFFSMGEVRWLQPDPDGREVVCGIQLDNQRPLRYPIFVSFETGTIDFLEDPGHEFSAQGLLRDLLEDTFFLKRGIGICFRHLEPFFGRHSAHETWHSDAKTRTGLDAAYLLAEALNVKVIERAMEKAFEFPDPSHVLTRDFLTELRRATEIEKDFLQLEQYIRSESARPYLRSLQLLLGQMYGTYNMLVLLYLHANGHTVLINRSSETGRSEALA